VGEAVLGHAKGDKVAAAYSRGDYIEKKRRMLDAWAGFCAVPSSGGKVVSLRRR
jgi:hypothetical protein